MNRFGKNNLLAPSGYFHLWCWMFAVAIGLLATAPLSAQSDKSSTASSVPLATTPSSSTTNTATTPPPNNSTSTVGATTSTTIVGAPPATTTVTTENEEEIRRKAEEAKLKAEQAKVAEQERRDRQVYCAKYEGRFINFYDEIFKVESCKRRRVESSKAQYDLTRLGITIQPVPAEVIAVIPEGATIDPTVAGGKDRGCKELEGKYVTYSNVDIYLVEKCAKRQFPDWETYQASRNKSRDPAGEILGLSYEEFSKLALGKDMPSVIDKEFAHVLDGSAGVDIIPVDEACHGLEGRFVGYYSRIYKIENCKKREISADKFFREQLYKDIRVKEINSEQWISLPDGRPI